VTKPEEVSRPEITVMVLRSHVREDPSSAMPPEIELKPALVVPAEIHIPETPGEMLGYPAARPEVEITPVTEVVSAQTAAPSLAATVGGSVRPSARIHELYGNRIRCFTSGPIRNSYQRFN